MRTIIVSVVLIACFSLAASQPTYCWTCPSGWAHWWDFGYSQPTNGDQCQCMKGTPATTTKAPTTTTTRSPTVAPSSPSTTPNCWTCPSGYTHWWVMGFTSAPGGDQCACVWGTTNAPATTTTNAPSPSTATPSSTPSCWTCPSGWAHWWTMGYTSAPGGDKCACVLGTATTTNAATTTTNAPTASNGATTTTNAPSSTPYCWTCPSGWAHWWTMGYTSAPGGDQCACVQGTATTTNAATTTTGAPTTTTTTKAATTTTSAPATTTTQTPMSTPYCWTCPSGYSHWWEFGYSAPPGGDKCECIKGNAGPTTTSAATTTTKAATTTTNAPTPSTATPSSTPSCWTCPSGWSHWWTMGYTSAPSGDQCACVQGSSGSTPTTTTRTPSAPTAAPSNALQKFINLLTPNSNSPGSVSFSPYIAPYSPWNGPPMDLIDQLGSVLAKTTGFRTVMIYYTEPYLVGSCVRNGMNVFGIISLNADANNNEYVINLAIDTARKYPNNVIGLACGNELGMQLGVTYNTAAIINNCITRIKAANLGIPVGVTDTYSSWTANGVWSAVSNNADFIGANIYAWYNNMYIPPPFTCETPDNGPQNTYNQFVKVQSMYPNIPVVLSEFGWPSCGAGYNCVSPNVVDGSTCAKANDANQKKFVQSVVDIFRKNSKPCNTFAAFREAWKGTNSADINEYWGVCSASAPYSCFNAPV